MVKQNDALVTDHSRGCDKLILINEMLKNDLMKTEIISSTVPTNSNKKKRSKL